MEQMPRTGCGNLMSSIGIAWQLSTKSFKVADITKQLRKMHFDLDFIYTYNYPPYLIMDKYPKPEAFGLKGLLHRFKVVFISLHITDTK